MPSPFAPQPLTLIRLAVAGIIAAHGWARLLAGGVVPFGGFLDAQGFPYGVTIAWAITLHEVAGSPLLAWGRRFLAPLALVYAAIYAMGIVLVHAKAGWFVVGLGRNGMEFSVLLVTCLLALAWHGLGRLSRQEPARQKAAPAPGRPRPLA